MNSNNFLDLIDLYEDLVNVVYEIGSINSKNKTKITLKNHLLERRTELLGQIEDQREKLQMNQF